MGREIGNLRANYLQNQQEAHQADQKKFWKNTVSIIPGIKGSQGSTWLKSKEGAYIEQKETAAYINEYFTNIGPEVAS